MAGGLGARLFVQGDVISAADVNGYLMNQSMMRFATTAARDTAFGNGIAVGVTVGGVAGDGKPLLQEGMFAYIDSNNDVQFFNGSVWVSAPTFALGDGEVTTAKLADGAVTNTKLTTITTAGKIANSATTATASAAINTIVSRNGTGDGDFAAGTITANLIGNVTGDLTGGVTGSLIGNVTGNVTGDVNGTATYTAEWILGASGTSAYTFTGPGFTGAESDPTLYLVRGQKYKFTNTMGMHPFRIQSTANGSTGTAYNDGVTNNDVSNGTLIWDVQFDTPGNILYYQCTSHTTMGGKIYIVDAGVGTDVSVNTSGTITASSFVGPITGNVTGNVTGTASNASKIGNKTIYVGQNQPSVTPVTGDIWFQVTGITPTF